MPHFANGELVLDDFHIIIQAGRKGCIQGQNPKSLSLKDCIYFWEEMLQNFPTNPDTRRIQHREQPQQPVQIQEFHFSSK